MTARVYPLGSWRFGQSMSDMAGSRERWRWTSNAKAAERVVKARCTGSNSAWWCSYSHLRLEDKLNDGLS